MSVHILIRKFREAVRVLARVRLWRVLSPAILVLSAGCAVFYRAPEITFGGVAVERIGGEGASFEFALEVHNPNRYALGLEQMTYRLSVGGVEAASGATREPLRVPARGTATVRLPVSIEWARLGAGGLSILTSGSLDYTVDGEAAFTTPAGSFRRPYRRAGAIRYLPG
jgi:LEA14-like dessication related protein